MQINQIQKKEISDVYKKGPDTSGLVKIHYNAKFTEIVKYQYQ